MTAYEFYWIDEAGKEHFIGILPERRDRPETTSEESILSWGWKLMGNHPDVRTIYFVKVEI